MQDKLFICHHSKMAPDVSHLAGELRLRGIKPWIDKQGGFLIGDQSATEARRAIEEDCFGFLFYATEPTFRRPFIQKIEVPAALHRKTIDPGFVIAAVLRDLTFSQYQSLSTTAFGSDLSVYHSHRVPPLSAGPEAEDVLRSHHQMVARNVVAQHLSASRKAIPAETIGVQFSTRELLACRQDDTLTVDASWLLGNQHHAVQNPANWQRLHAGLLDTKQAIAQCYGRPRLRIHGSKHLTAAFMLGFVYPSTTGHIEIQTSDGYWTTDTMPSKQEFLNLEYSDGAVTSSDLFVELSLTGKPVRAAVNRYVQRTGRSPFMYLRGDLSDSATAKGSLDAAAACAIAQQIRDALGSLVATHPISHIHLFAAIPQGVAVMIGRSLNAMPPVQLYEYVEQQYRPSFRLESR